MGFGFRWHGLLLAATTLLCVYFVAGCGSGSGGTNTNLVNPVEKGTIGSVSGTLYTLVNGYMDIPGNVPVSITPVSPPPSGGTWPPSGTWPRTTTTNVTGSYQFPDMPIGTYKVSVPVTTNSIGEQIAGEIDNVVVRGSIPTLNVNLLLGKPGDTVTFTGTVTQNSAPKSGATVTMEVVAKPWPEDGTDSQRAVYVTTVTDTGGNYTLTVPNNRNPHMTVLAATSHMIDHYLISAHSTSSDVGESDYYFPPFDPATVNVAPIALNTTTNPTATTPTQLYLTSVSLPAPTQVASMQTAISRLAVARLTGAPATQVAMLQKMAQGRQQAVATRSASVRSAMGIVENDLTWEALQSSLDVQGYNIYRAPNNSNNFTMIGATHDPYENVFVDNDPTLPTDAPTYYTVTSYAGTKVSAPTKSLIAQPLKAITGVRTVDAVTGQPVTTATTKIKLRWDPVPGAQGYWVLLYTSQPSFNSTPDLSSEYSFTAAQNSYTFSYPGVGGSPITYWWTVAAFSLPPNQAWAAPSAAYSAYNQFTLSP